MAEPLGVALIIAPWNYPFQLTMSPLIGALAAGNCAIVKPVRLCARQPPVVLKLLNIIYDECYARGHRRRPGRKYRAFRTTFYRHDLFHRRCQVGRLVIGKASRWLTPVTLELGGKSPCLVDASADIELWPHMDHFRQAAQRRTNL